MCTCSVLSYQISRPFNCLCIWILFKNPRRYPCFIFFIQLLKNTLKPAHSVWETCTEIPFCTQHWKYTVCMVKDFFSFLRLVDQTLRNWQKIKYPKSHRWLHCCGHLWHRWHCWYQRRRCSSSWRPPGLAPCRSSCLLHPMTSSWSSCFPFSSSSSPFSWVVCSSSFSTSSARGLKQHRDESETWKDLSTSEKHQTIRYSLLLEDFFFILPLQPGLEPAIPAPLLCETIFSYTENYLGFFSLSLTYTKTAIP